MMFGEEEHAFTEIKELYKIGRGDTGVG